MKKCPLKAIPMVFLVFLLSLIVLPFTYAKEAIVSSIQGFATYSDDKQDLPLLEALKSHLPEDIQLAVEELRRAGYFVEQASLEELLSLSWEAKKRLHLLLPGIYALRENEEAKKHYPEALESAFSALKQAYQVVYYLDLLLDFLETRAYLDPFTLGLYQVMKENQTIFVAKDSTVTLFVCNTTLLLFSQSTLTLSCKEETKDRSAICLTLRGSMELWQEEEEALLLKTDLVLMELEQARVFLSHEKGSTRITLKQGRMYLTHKQTGERLLLEEGESVRLSVFGFGPITKEIEDSWKKKRLGPYLTLAVPPHFREEEGVLAPFSHDPFNTERLGIQLAEPSFVMDQILKNLHEGKKTMLNGQMALSIPYKEGETEGLLYVLVDPTPTYELLGIITFWDSKEGAKQLLQILGSLEVHFGVEKEGTLISPFLQEEILVFLEELSLLLCFLEEEWLAHPATIDDFYDLFAAWNSDILTFSLSLAEDFARILDSAEKQLRIHPKHIGSFAILLDKARTITEQAKKEARR